MMNFSDLCQGIKQQRQKIKSNPTTNLKLILQYDLDIDEILDSNFHSNSLHLLVNHKNGIRQINLETQENQLLDINLDILDAKYRNKLGQFLTVNKTGKLRDYDKKCQLWSELEGHNQIQGKFKIYTQDDLKFIYEIENGKLTIYEQMICDINMCITKFVKKNLIMIAKNLQMIHINNNQLRWIEEGEIMKIDIETMEEFQSESESKEISEIVVGDGYVVSLEGKGKDQIMRVQMEKYKDYIVKIDKEMGESLMAEQKVAIGIQQGQQVLNDVKQNISISNGMPVQNNKGLVQQGMKYRLAGTQGIDIIFLYSQAIKFRMLALHVREKRVVKVPLDQLQIDQLHIPKYQSNNSVLEFYVVSGPIINKFNYEINLGKVDKVNKVDKQKQSQTEQEKLVDSMHEDNQMKKQKIIQIEQEKNADSIMFDESLMKTIDQSQQNNLTENKFLSLCDNILQTVDEKSSYDDSMNIQQHPQKEIIQNHQQITQQPKKEIKQIEQLIIEFSNQEIIQNHQQITLQPKKEIKQIDKQIIHQQIIQQPQEEEPIVEKIQQQSCIPPIASLEEQIEKVLSNTPLVEQLVSRLSGKVIEYLSPQMESLQSFKNQQQIELQKGLQELRNEQDKFRQEQNYYMQNSIQQTLQMIQNQFELNNKSNNETQQLIRKQYEKTKKIGKKYKENYEQLNKMSEQLEISGVKKKKIEEKNEESYSYFGAN